jgi:hypothetical protein
VSAQYGDVTADGFKFGCFDCEDGKPHEPHQRGIETEAARYVKSRWPHRDRLDRRALVDAFLAGMKRQRAIGDERGEG